VEHKQFWMIGAGEGGKRFCMVGPDPELEPDIWVPVPQR